jgi:hypothetical protein
MQQSSKRPFGQLKFLPCPCIYDLACLLISSVSFMESLRKEFRDGDDEDSHSAVPLSVDFAVTPSHHNFYVLVLNP